MMMQSKKKEGAFGSETTKVQRSKRRSKRRTLSLLCKLTGGMQIQTAATTPKTERLELQSIEIVVETIQGEPCVT